MSANGAAAGQKEQRLIVVSNRLPVTISKDAQGTYHFKASFSSPVFEHILRS
jgi:trehalose 6-phosphate synthase